MPKRELTDIEKENALENFLLDIDCLDPLEKWTGKLNIFDVLSVSQMEIRHSNFLAWLLDSNETHGLGDYFLKKLLQKIIKVCDLNKRPFSVYDIDGMDLDDVRVYREESNIDLFVVSEKEKIVLTIENKIHSSEHDKQLERYFEHIRLRYPNHRCVFAYLTLFGDFPSDSRWVPISYDIILEMIKSILNNKQLTDRCRIYLEDYADALGSELMNDEELKSVCNNIYANHKDAIDLIIRNIPNRHTTIKKRIDELLAGYGDKIIRLTSSDGYIRFTTPRVRAKAGQIGYDTWVKSKDVLVFEVDNSQNSRYLSFFIGRCDNEIKRKWFEYFINTKVYKNQNKTLNDDLHAIAIYRMKDDYDTDEEFINAFVQNVKKFIDHIDEIESIVENGPDIKSD